MSDLALPDPSEFEVLSLDAARDALARLVRIADVRDVGHRASALADYLRRAKAAQDMVDRAIALQVLAERRAGELIDREKLEGGQRGEYLKSLRTTANVVRRWVAFASTPDRLLRDVLESESPLTISGVLRRLETTSVERVEKGIYRSPSGRYFVTWRDHGVKHRKMVGTDLLQARRELLALSGKVQRRKRPPSRINQPLIFLTEAYNGVRRSLGDCQTVMRHSEARIVKGHLEAAMAHLYKAEDELTRALKELG